MGAGSLLIINEVAVRARAILVEGITRSSYVLLEQRLSFWCGEVGCVASTIAALVERRYS
jgi:hypothetical protein